MSDDKVDEIEVDEDEKIPPIDPDLLKFANRVGAVIMGASILITLFLVGMMSTQLLELNKPPKAEAITRLDTDLKTYKNVDADLIARAYLEHDAQYLRTKRAQSLVSAKLFINSLGIMSGILLMTMGSAFIFARIKTPKNNLEIGSGTRLTGDSAVDAETAKSRPYLVFASYSPGLFFALFGTILIAVAVTKSASQPISTSDFPVFLQSYNAGAKTPKGQNKSSLLDADGNYLPDNECKTLGHLDPAYCEKQPDQ